MEVLDAKCLLLDTHSSSQLMTIHFENGTECQTGCYYPIPCTCKHLYSASTETRTSTHTLCVMLCHWRGGLKMTRSGL